MNSWVRVYEEALSLVSSCRSTTLYLSFIDSFWKQTKVMLLLIEYPTTAARCILPDARLSMLVCQSRRTCSKCRKVIQQRLPCFTQATSTAGNSCSSAYLVFLDEQAASTASGAKLRLTTSERSRSVPCGARG